MIGTKSLVQQAAKGHKVSKVVRNWRENGLLWRW